MARKGCRTGKRYCPRRTGRTQEHSKLRVDVNLTIYLKLWLPLDEKKGDLIFQKVCNSRFGVDETQIDPASEQHDTKPCNFFYFFDIFLLVRSTTGVTTKNLSLNKWKTWPAEFFEDCKKCEKNFTRWKLKLWRQIWKFLNFQTHKLRG